MYKQHNPMQACNLMVNFKNSNRYEEYLKDWPPEIAAVFVEMDEILAELEPWDIDQIWAEIMYNHEDE